MLVNIFAWLIIPVYTILFTTNTNLFTTNFSVISSYLDRRLAFVLWGFMVGSYFYVCLRRIHRTQDSTKAEPRLMRGAAVLLFMAVTTPYMPDMLPLKSFLHVVFAFCASVLLMCCIGLMLIRLYRKSPDDYRHYLYAYGVIIVFCVALFFIAGIISSALEIFFVIACTLLVRQLYQDVRT